MTLEETAVTNQKEHLKNTLKPDYSSTNADQIAEDPDDTICSWYSNCQPDVLQRFARPSCLLLWLCLASFTQGLLVNGFVNSVLTTLERRYDLTSTESGMIASMYDVGCVICLVPVTYIGRRYRRSRPIAIGLIIMSLGSFIFALPQFVSKPYSYRSPVSPLCYASDEAKQEFCPKQTALNNYKFVFWLGQFLHGIGSSPLYTLGVAYIDDNLTLKQSGLFLSAYYTMSLIGPALGYLLGGIFLTIYVDPGKRPTDLSPTNTSLWVGAWWIGFVLSGSIALTIVVPMFGFPSSFPGSARIRQERTQETHDNSEVKTSHIEMRSKMDLLRAIHAILTNPTFIFLSLGGATQAVLVTALSTFGPKVLQTLFFLRADTANFTLGLVTIPSAALGLLVGGILLRFTNLTVRPTLWICVAITGVDAMFGLGFLARCDLLKFAGVNTDYPLTPNQPTELNASCNSNCNCQESKFMYSPLCGADSIIYYSPCFAGCQQNGTLIDGTKYYGNCSCISGRLIAGGANYSAMEGTCKDSNCNKMPLFIALLGTYIFGIFVISVPTLQITMRVIPAKLKDLGLGLQWIIFRVCGSIPGPLMLGKLIDTTCTKWVGGCGKRGFCSFYNGDSFWISVVIFTMVLKGLEILFLALSAVVYVPPEEAVDQEQEKQVNQQVDKENSQNREESNRNSGE